MIVKLRLGHRTRRHSNRVCSLVSLLLSPSIASALESRGANSLTAPPGFGLEPIANPFSRLVSGYEKRQNLGHMIIAAGGHNLVFVQALGAALSGFAAIATVVVLVLQLRILQRQNELIRISTEAMNQDNNKNAFFSLLLEIDNIITRETVSDFRKEFGPDRDEAIEGDFKKADKAELKEDSKFLKWFSDKVKGVSESDHFRRNSLFGAFKRLHEVADDARKRLFRDVLNARIGDEAARLLIFQAVRERDESALMIFGSFPFAFQNLHRMESLRIELVRRFAKPFAKEIQDSVDSIKKS